MVLIGTDYTCERCVTENKMGNSWMTNYELLVNSISTRWNIFMYAMNLLLIAENSKWRCIYLLIIF